MAVLRLTILIGIVIFLVSPSVAQFLKAALGFRIGISPTEKGYGQKGYYGHQGTGMNAKVLSGVQGQPPNHHGGQGGGGGGHGGSMGGNFVRHLKILGVNLYLGGHQKPQLGWKPSHDNGGPNQNQKQIQLYNGYGHHHGGQEGNRHPFGSHYYGNQAHHNPEAVKAQQGQPNFGGIDYSQNEVSSNLIGKVYSPKLLHQQNVMQLPAASQIPSYSKEIKSEIQLLNGQAQGQHPSPQRPQPPQLQSFKPLHFSGPPPSKGFSLASLMKGPQWSPKSKFGLGLFPSRGPPPPYYQGPPPHSQGPPPTQWSPLQRPQGPPHPYPQGAPHKNAQRSPHQHPQGPPLQHPQGSPHQYPQGASQQNSQGPPHQYPQGSPYKHFQGFPPQHAQGFPPQHTQGPPRPRYIQGLRSMLLAQQKTPIHHPPLIHQQIPKKASSSYSTLFPYKQQLSKPSSNPSMNQNQNFNYNPSANEIQSYSPQQNFQSQANFPNKLQESSFKPHIPPSTFNNFPNFNAPSFNPMPAYSAKTPLNSGGPPPGQSGGPFSQPGAPSSSSPEGSNFGQGAASNPISSNQGASSYFSHGPNPFASESQYNLGKKDQAQNNFPLGSPAEFGPGSQNDFGSSMGMLQGFPNQGQQEYSPVGQEGQQQYPTGSQVQHDFSGRGQPQLPGAFDQGQPPQAYPLIGGQEGQQEYSPNARQIEYGQGGDQGQVGIFDMNSMPFKLPEGYEYSHSVSSPVVSMTKYTKDDPPVMMDPESMQSQFSSQKVRSNNNPGDYRNSPTTSETSIVTKDNYNLNSDNFNTQIQAPFKMNKRVSKGKGRLSMSMMTAATNNQHQHHLKNTLKKWTPMPMIKKSKGMSSSAENRNSDMQASPTEVSILNSSLERSMIIRKRTTTAVPVTTSTSSSYTVTSKPKKA